MSRQIFLPLVLQLCCDVYYYVAIFYLWFFLTFVTIIFSFVVTEFLTVACCCCRDRYFLCRDIVLLSCTAESELYVATDLENVATYFLHCSLSLAELFVVILKSLSQ